ncbi:hypothetical protein CCYA_CCYA07G1973 [Cyanidiococcus yangmingshanensis]|nr:hypothetical protein CCYA_CCYA07G1973 [Cyanidiococcus yangmingshanensis]
MVDSALDRSVIVSLDADEDETSSRSTRRFPLTLDGWLVTTLGIGLPLLLDRFIPPRVAPISLQDPSVQFSRRSEIVPAPVLLLFAYVVPLVALAWHAKQRRCSYSWNGASNAGVLLWIATGVVEANGVALLATVVLKLLVGRPRPYFALVCERYLDGHEMKTCAGDVWQVREARKAFPSGHAALAFSAVTHWQYRWLQAGLARSMLACFRGTHTLRLTLLLLPWVLAMLIAVSRVIDHHHDVVDITAGALVGCACAYLATWNRYGDEDHRLAEYNGEGPSALPISRSLSGTESPLTRVTVRS